MKFLVFTVVIVLTVCNRVRCAYVDPSHLENTRKAHIAQYKAQQEELIEKYKQSVDKVCPGYGEKFDEAAKKSMECADNINEDNQTVCQVILNNLTTCAKPITEMFKECLPQKSKDIPDFIVKSALSVTQYICNIDGEHFLEFANPCITVKNAHTGICMKQVRKTLKKYGTDSPSKVELCKLAEDLKPCYHKHMDNSCYNKIAKESFDGLYHALFTKPCAS